MDKGAQDRSLTWKKIYEEKRDILIENIGRSVGSDSPNWYRYIIKELKDLLDIIDMLEKDTEFFYNENSKLYKLNDELIKRLEKRDNDITDILMKMEKWIKIYQPVLDKVAEEYDMLEKVKKDD